MKSGYRNISPLMNGRELSANFLNGGLLRPVYADGTKPLPDGNALNTNTFTTPSFTQIRHVQAGFCLTCHNPHVERMGNPNLREVAELAGVLQDFRPDPTRPLRDYHLVDALGRQVLAFSQPAQNVCARLARPARPARTRQRGSANRKCVRHVLATLELCEQLSSHAFLRPDSTPSNSRSM
jgi:hypothetical protein